MNHTDREHAVNLAFVEMADTLVKDFDVTRKSHLLLGTVNLFYFWQVGVVSVGVAKVTGATFTRALPLVFICYAFTELLLIYTGLGQFAL